MDRQTTYIPVIVTMSGGEASPVLPVVGQIPRPMRVASWAASGLHIPVGLSAPAIAVHVESLRFHKLLYLLPLATIPC